MLKYKGDITEDEYEENFNNASKSEKLEMMRECDDVPAFR